MRMLDMGEQSQGLSSNDRREQPNHEDAPRAADTAGPRSRQHSVSSDGARPPLPPRPDTLNLLDEGTSPAGGIRQSAPQNLQGKATTAVSLTEIGFQQSQDDGKDVYAAQPSLPGNLRARASLSQLASPRGSETGDSASIRSSAPNVEAGEVENIFSDFAAEPGGIQQDDSGLLQFPEFWADDVDDDFASEFEPVGEVDEGGENEGS